MIVTDRKYRLPRKWSNKELKKVAHIFIGDIVNISACEDKDKEGGYYKGYFVNAKNYFLTNYSTIQGRKAQDNEIFLDLSKDIPANLQHRFDVVFNHTTLEHIFDVRRAFKNICSISKDIVILVVPFAQEQHESGAWKDYWRFTPSCVREMFNENNMKVIYEAESRFRNSGIYLFFIASRYPEKWQDKIPKHTGIKIAGKWIGSSLLPKLYRIIFREKSYEE